MAIKLKKKESLVLAYIFEVHDFYKNAPTTGMIMEKMSLSRSGVKGILQKLQMYGYIDLHIARPNLVWIVPLYKE